MERIIACISTISYQEMFANMQISVDRETKDRYLNMSKIC